MNNSKDLCERLNAMLSHRGDGVPTQFINPDGPDAAARIEALNARVEELEALAYEAIAAWNDVVPYHRPGGRALGRLHLVMSNLDKALKDTDND